MASVKPVRELVTLARGRQLAAMDKAADLGACQARPADAFAKVEAQQQASGDAFGTRESHAVLAKAHRQLMQARVGATPDDTFQHHGSRRAAGALA